MDGKGEGVEKSQIRQRNEQAALYRFTDRLYRADSLAEVYEAALDAILSALQCDRASILFFDEAGVMRFVASRGLSESYRRLVEGHSPWKPDDTNPVAICTNDIAASDGSDELKKTIMSEGIRALAFIPITAGGSVIGKFMTYYDASHEFADNEVDLALTIARQLGFSVERNRTEKARRSAEDELRRNEERFRQIIDSAKEYAIITLDEHRNITSWNSGAERLLGYEQSEILGKSGDIFFVPDDRAAEVPEQELRMARELGRVANERWHMRKDGSRFWGSGFMLPVEDSEHDAFLKIFRDRTEEREAEERQKLLVAELNHRVKNTLATVQSFADQTLKSAESPVAFANAFRKRLLAFADAHDLLTREGWRSARVADIARAVLRPWLEEKRAQIAGPNIRIDPKKALALSIAFNELMTNAMKYGALSVPGGQVTLTWTCDSICEIRWVELDGPAVAPPTRQGFGLRILNRALAAELGRPVNLQFDPAGVRCSILLDLQRPAGTQDPLAHSQE